MSHFYVLVVGDNPEEQIKKYHINDTIDPDFNKNAYFDHCELINTFYAIDEYHSNDLNGVKRVGSCMKGKINMIQMEDESSDSALKQFALNKYLLAKKEGKYVHTEENEKEEKKYIDAKKREMLMTTAILMNDKWYLQDNFSDWGGKFYEIWDSIASDTLVSVFDCHI